MAIFWQSPEGILERTTIIEVIVDKLSISIKTCYIATVVDSEECGGRSEECGGRSVEGGVRREM